MKFSDVRSTYGKGYIALTCVLSEAVQEEDPLELADDDGKFWVVVRSFEPVDQERSAFTLECRIVSAELGHTATHYLGMPFRGCFTSATQVIPELSTSW